MNDDTFKLVSVAIGIASEIIFDSDDKDDDDGETNSVIFTGFAENMIPTLSDAGFKSHFRVSLNIPPDPPDMCLTSSLSTLEGSRLMKESSC